ncbi:MAG: Dolichyl-phosphate-mannose-protein mannosyltransferase, partial [Actinomycetota bacterium]
AGHREHRPPTGRSLRRRGGFGRHARQASSGCRQGLGVRFVTIDGMASIGMVSVGTVSHDRLGRILDDVVVRRVAIGLFTVFLVVLAAHGGPLGWDESVYSALGRDLAATNFDWDVRAGAYWSDVRAPGLPAFQAVFFEVFGASDFVARLPGIIASTALLWVIARTLDLFAARRVGTTAVVMIGLCPGFVATSTLAFADHLAALFVALAVFVAAGALQARSGARLWPVPLLLGLATTTRFGAVLIAAAPLMAIGGAVVIDAVRRRSALLLRSFVVTGLASGVVVLGLLQSTLLTRVSTPAAATRSIVDAGARPTSQGFRDLVTIMSPGPVDYGFGGAF